MKKITCKYRCQECKHEFEREIPGPIICEKCSHKYIDLLNYKEVLKHLKNNE